QPQGLREGARTPRRRARSRHRPPHDRREPRRARLRGSRQPGRRGRCRPGASGAAGRAARARGTGGDGRVCALARGPPACPADAALAAAREFAGRQRHVRPRARRARNAGRSDPAVSGSLASSVRQAVIWRSGSQIAAQVIAWTSTLAVVRILDPSDYGLFAMTQVVLAFLSFLNGYGFASSLIQDREIDPVKVRQAFGMLLLVNAAIALIQLAIAPAAAAWYRQPMIADLLRVQALIYLATPFIAL